jgi:hypothetical protein
MQDLRRLGVRVSSLYVQALLGTGHGQSNIFETDPRVVWIFSKWSRLFGCGLDQFQTVFKVI